MRRTAFRRFGCFIVTLQMFFLIGCHGLPLDPGGTKIRQGYEIPIVKGSKKFGTYRTRDLLITYNYSENNGIFRIFGTVGFDDSLRYNFTEIRHFHLGVILGDAQGNILLNRGLAGTGYSSPEYEVRFDNTFKLPEQAASFAFTYSGKATEGGRYDIRGGGDRMETDFWQYPIVR